MRCFIVLNQVRYSQCSVYNNTQVNTYISLSLSEINTPDPELHATYNIRANIPTIINKH